MFLELKSGYRQFAELLTHYYTLFRREQDETSRVKSAESKLQITPDGEKERERERNSQVRVEIKEPS